jgi:hypothetical protein
MSDGLKVLLGALGGPLLALLYSGPHVPRPGWTSGMLSPQLGSPTPPVLAAPGSGVWGPWL